MSNTSTQSGGLLAGKRIAITRAVEQSATFIALLQAEGAEVVLAPAIAIVPPRNRQPLDQGIARLDTYDWVIATSVNGVQALCTRMQQLGMTDIPAPFAGKQIGAIGPATAQEWQKYGITPTFMPSQYVAESILAEIGDVQGKRIFLPRADIAREVLATGLRERGAIVDEVAAYHTEPGEGPADIKYLLEEQHLDAITFTSSSTVRYTLQGLQDLGLSPSAARTLLNQTSIACIGPVTAQTAQEQGLHVAVMASEYTIEGLVAALKELLASR